MFISFQKFLGDYAENLFSDPEALEAKARFKAELKSVCKKIHNRNEMLEVPYAYLLPERIPNSIAI